MKTNRWYNYRKANNKFPKVRKKELELMLTKVNPQSGEIIIECGIGNGYLTFPVARKVGEKGKVIALVGESGGGKSTMADILPRFYDVSEGELLVDGKNIKALKINETRALMGIVSQESILFNDSIFNNIAFGKKNVSENDVTGVVARKYRR